MAELRAGQRLTGDRAEGPARRVAGSETVARWLGRVPVRFRRAVPFGPRGDLRRRLAGRHPWELGYDLEAPPTDGLPVGPPDFIGVGASLCGGGWWYGMVAAHPGVADRAGRPVGLHYFSHFCTRAFTTEDGTRYHRWFPRPPGQLTGEWTAGYSAEPWVAPLLAEAAPEARLLYMVRDPVERFRLGLDRIAESRVPNVGAAVADVVDRGFYAVQLRRLLEFVPRERILVLQLEQCWRDPAGQLAATDRFLGLDTDRRPPSVATAPPRLPPAAPIDPSVTERLTDLYATDVVDLAALVPSLDLDLWPTAGGSGGPGRARGR